MENKDLEIPSFLKKRTPQKKERFIRQSYVISASRHEFSIDEMRILHKITEFLMPLIDGQPLNIPLERGQFGVYYMSASARSFYPEKRSGYDKLYLALKSLSEKGIEVKTANLWQNINTIAFPKVLNGRVSFLIHDKMLKEMINFSLGFRKFSFSTAISFRSSYASRLYVLMANISKPITYSIDTLRYMLCLEEKYSNTKDVIRLIRRSKKEVDEKSTNTFDIEVIKKGRSAESIRFIPIKKEDVDNEDSVLTPSLPTLSSFFSEELLSSLQNVFYFSKKEILKNINLFRNASLLIEDFSVLLRTLSETNEFKKAINPKGLLIYTLKRMMEQKGISRPDLPSQHLLLSQDISVSKDEALKYTKKFHKSYSYNPITNKDEYERALIEDNKNNLNKIKL